MFGMKKVGFIFLVFLLVCTPLLFTSCDALVDDFTTVEIPLDDVQFDIPIKLDLSDSKQSSQLKRTNVGLVPFFGESDKINLQSDMFGGIQEYSDYKFSLLVSDVKIQITTTDKSGTRVSDFITTTTGTKKSFSYKKEGTIDIGTDYSDDDLTEYTKKIVLAIQEGKTVSIDAAGLTDIIPAEIEEAEIAVISIIPSITAEVKLIKN